MILIQKRYNRLTLTGNLNRGKNNDGQNINDDAIIFFIFKEEKENILDFSKETVKVF